MILTCPRCATRYLADETQVWATGRTVECGGCGQRWRAFGGGVDPQSSVPAADEASPRPAPTFRTPMASFLGDLSEDDEPAPLPGFRPIDVVARPAPPPAPVEEPLAAPALFRTPRRPARTSRYGPPGVGAGLSILFLILLAGVVAMVFRDAIVKRFPPLANVYQALDPRSHA